MNEECHSDLMNKLNNVLETIVGFKVLKMFNVYAISIEGRRLMVISGL